MAAITWKRCRDEAIRSYLRMATVFELFFLIGAEHSMAERTNLMASKKRKKSKPETMADTSGDSAGDGWGPVLAVGGAIVGGALLYYVKAGAGSEKNAALVPDIVEDPIDQVVDALNRKFGKKWVDQTLSVLEKALEHALPAKTVAFVRLIHRAELMAKEEKIVPSEKKAWAQARIAQMRLN